MKIKAMAVMVVILIMYHSPNLHAMDEISISLNSVVLDVDCILIDGTSYIELDKAQSLFNHNFETLEVTDIRSKPHITTRNIAEAMYYDVYWHGEQRMVELYRKITSEEKKIVAHGGGLHKGFVTSTKTAIDNAYANKVKLIEVDIIWTTDNVPVLSHDWWIVSQFSNRPYIEEGYTYDAFMNFYFWNDWEQLSFDGLIHWMKVNNEALIITDVKERNIELLTLIKDKYPELKNRFIPQVYNYSEYLEASDLGFENIILSLYKTTDSKYKIFEFVKNNSEKCFAVTMPESRAMSGLPSMLDKIDVYSYCHTINDYETREVLSTVGIDGFYTDVFDVEFP